MASATYTTDRKPIGNAQKLFTYDSQALLPKEKAVTRPATLVEVILHNATGGTVYFQLHDANAEPANGSVPRTIPVAVGANSAASYSPPGGQLEFDTSIWWFASTTLATLTKSAGNDLWVEIAYF